MARLVLVICLLSLAVSTTTAARTWYVRQDGTGDAPTIAAGIDSAAAGDIVEVMCGTYYEHDITMKSGVYLTSESGLAGCVTIDAKKLGRVFYCDMNDSTTCMVGLTMANGTAAGEGGGMYASHSHLRVTNCTFTGNFAMLRGAGMAIYNSRAVFTGCVFSLNRRGATSFYMGGGVYAGGGFPKFYGCTFSDNTSPWGYGGGFASEYSCAPTLDGCVFERNIAEMTGGAHIGSSGVMTVSGCVFRDNEGGSYGPGGMSCGDGSVTDCLFEGNSTRVNGGGMECFGADVTISDCTFRGNSSEGYGAGLYAYSCSPIVTRCQFIENTTTSNGGGLFAEYYSLPYIDHCLFAENHANRKAGAVGAGWRSGVTLDNCTLSGNSAGTSGGGVSCTDTSSAILHKSIIAFSTDGEALYWDGKGTTPSLSCCDLYGNEGGDWVGAIAGQYGVAGNTSEDPLFCDPDLDDYTISDLSPCAPDNSPAGCGLIGAYDVGCGPAGVGGQTGLRSAGLHLDPVVPNPFSGNAEIAYCVPGGAAASHVVLEIFDVRGRCVRSLVDHDVPAGEHRATWDGKDNRGRPAVAGVYFCRLEWQGEARTRLLVLSD